MRTPRAGHVGSAVALAILIAFFGRSVAAQSASVARPHAALQSGDLGLYAATLFRTADGRCADCAAPRQGLWYFADELLAVPKHATADLPFFSWLGSPEVIEGARLQPGGHDIQLASGAGMGFALVRKISSNRSYYNDATERFLAGRPLRLRGHTEASASAPPQFVARVIWPEDNRIDAAALRPSPLGARESLTTLIQAEGAGSTERFDTRLLWARDGAIDRTRDRRAVLALMLNGAQGDDDEAHGGHFAVVTGRQHGDGAWADWMVNNFYNLNSVSEKGIVASMLPMDNYLMDLNSGQSWYRPSYLLVAVLRGDTAATLYQTAVQRVYDRLYRHDLEYDHAKANCAGLSVDTLAGLGWHAPTLGPTSYPKAALGYFYSSFTDGSFSSGRRSFDYMTAERSRLFPRAAFETLGADLLSLATSSARARTPYEKRLADEIDAIVFVRIPQVPSSRASGTFPVASYDEYMARVPKDRKDWKIVPVDARPFPDGLRDRPAPRPFLNDTAIGVLATGGLLLVVSAPGAWWCWRRRRNARGMRSR